MAKSSKWMEEGRMNRKVLNEEEIKAMCKRLRLHAMDMALAAGNRGAHISGSLSNPSVDFVIT